MGEVLQHLSAFDAVMAAVAVGAACLVAYLVAAKGRLRALGLAQEERELAEVLKAAVTKDEEAPRRAPRKSRRETNPRL